MLYLLPMSSMAYQKIVKRERIMDRLFGIEIVLKAYISDSKKNQNDTNT